ncbi:hypothetical protein ANAPH2_00296 [Anaplasma phagocytophilum]|nr:hypothetical protein ANAPH2_00296 [Anaplasma phagocytophilum]
MYSVKNDLMVIYMNLGKKPLLRKPQTTPFILEKTAIGDASPDHLKKPDVTNSSANTAALQDALRSHKKDTRYSDKVYIFFSEEEKKGIVTLYESSIQSIQIYSNSSENLDTQYTMVAILNKITVGQDKKRKASRNISIRAFHHEWENKDFQNVKPEITLIAAGKDYNTRTETYFSPPKNQSIPLIGISTSKYVEYRPMIEKHSKTFLEKALPLHINKKSIITTILESYILKKNSRANTKVAIYLVENFLPLIPKTTLAALKKGALKLKRICLEEGSNTTDLNEVDRLCLSLNSAAFPAPYSITETNTKALKEEVFHLIKERACQYEHLHEALSKDAYKSIISVDLEEIVACYTNKSNQFTSTLLKKCISANKNLSHKMAIVHRYIDELKKRSVNNNAKPLILDCQLPGAGEDFTFAHNSLISLAKKNAPQEVEFCVDHIIEEAKRHVAKKYSTIFLRDVMGITEKVSAHVNKMSVKINKMQHNDELQASVPHNSTESCNLI